MIDAEIKTRNGTVIHIKGTTEEVNEIVALWQRREDFLLRRRVFFSGGKDREFVSSNLRKAVIPTGSSIYSPKEEIMKLVNSEFFNKPKTLGEIKKELNKTVNIPISSIHPTLIALIGQNILERAKNEENFWVYFLKKKNK